MFCFAKAFPQGEPHACRAHLPRESEQTTAVSIATGEEKKEKACQVNDCQIAFCLCLAALGFSLI